jgi:PAS domain S-box-containing protein
MQKRLEQAALRTSVLYGFVAALWILLSDRVLVAVVSDPAAIGRLATYKGWAFVSVTALLLYATLRRQLWRWEQGIAERQRAEETVRESEDKYRTIFETTGTATVILEEDTTISLANTEFERLSGFSREEIEGKKSWTEFVVKDDLELMRKHHYARRDDPDSAPRNYEFRFLNRQGSVRDILLSIALIPGTNKTVASLLDITESKRAKEELRRSEQQMAILNQIANIFLTLPGEEMYGEVLDVIRKELRSPLGVFGFIEDNGDLVIPSMTQEVWDQCQILDKSIVFPSSTWGDSLWGKAIREKRPFSSAGPLRTPEGHVRIDNFLAMPIVFQNETIGLMSVANKEGGYTEEDKNLLQSIVFNISPILHARLQRDRQELKRKYAEEQLRQLTYRQEILLGAIPDIVMEGDTNKVYTWANPSGYAFFGDDVIGKEAAKYFVREQDACAKVQNLFSGDSSLFYVESWQRRKDGENRLLAWWCKRLKDCEGRVSGTLSTARDITDLPRTEEALQESDKKSKRMAQETAIIAEIGRIVSSTLDVDSVYERFAQTAGKLLDFDRISINIIDWEKNTVNIAYSWGTEVEGRNSKDMIPFIGSGTEEVFRTRKSVFIQTEDENELANRFPGYLPNFKAGIQSALFTPLFIRDEVIGSLSFLSKRPRAYADRDRELGEYIGYQIAGAIANAQLYLERMKAEDRILASLREKEVLLKEVHHRVKNNLQIISSLINLQSRNVQDPRALEVLRESQNRVRSLALVHERLYRSSDLSRVDFGEYIRNMVSSLFSSYSSLAQGVAYEIDAGETLVGVDLAIPCGLVLNELISNALKHAFPDGKRGKVFISFHRRGDGPYVLRVKDNGVGFPPGLDILKTETLGFQLVHTLTRQLAGSLELNREGGTEITFTFGDGDPAGGKHG